MYPLKVPEAYIEIANIWHGGQTSALYSVASTGLIHTDTHKSKLLYELRHCGDNIDTGLFEAWVKSLPEPCVHCGGASTMSFYANDGIWHVCNEDCKSALIASGGYHD